MAQFDLSKYAQVADRIPKFWESFPDGAIDSELVRIDGPEVVMKVTLYRTPGVLLATGWAREIEGRSPVNKTSHLENAETSALGRALANAGFPASTERASREEMEKVQRQQQEHDEALTYIRDAGPNVTDEALKARVRNEWPRAKQEAKVAYRLAEEIGAALEAAAAVGAA